MPRGPGKYDAACTAAREQTQSHTCLLVVGGGAQGHGFSLQTIEPLKAALVLPQVLREVAAQIEADMPVRATPEIPADAPRGEWQEMPESGHTWYRLVIGAHLLWIEPRAGHCDRGRFSGNYRGAFYIDAADGFPRYYMDLDRAKDEMREWLLHRIRCESQR